MIDMNNSNGAGLMNWANGWIIGVIVWFSFLYRVTKYISINPAVFAVCLEVKLSNKTQMFKYLTTANVHRHQTLITAFVT